MLKCLPISGQVFDWFLGVFVRIVSFLFNKVLFGLFLSSFIEDSFYFIFLMKCYFDLFFYISVDFGIGSNKEM